jgi:signal transduction histidine kinase
MYEWGKYQVKQDEKSTAMIPLSHPLGSWKLEYYAPALTGATTTNSLSIVVGVLLIGIALTALATYLYREHQREVRVAQQRVNFVNQVSHELKTPLTNIRLYAELLETEVADVFDDEQQQEGEKARKYIAIITAESQRLSRLIANVLRFGQLQKSQLDLRLQAAKLDEVIQRCVLAFSPALKAKGIVVSLDLHANILVMLDTEALEQILNNLISNAEKYAASGAALHISSTQTFDLSTILVRDFGLGIAALERVRIFQPFYRVSSLLSDGVTGTGIGLDIARQLARLHGGDLVLQEVDIGACFKLTLHTPAAKGNT